MLAWILFVNLSVRPEPHMRSSVFGVGVDLNHFRRVRHAGVPISIHVSCRTPGHSHGAQPCPGSGRLAPAMPLADVLRRAHPVREPDEQSPEPEEEIDPVAAREQQLKDKRRRQTQRARVQSLLSRQKRTLMKIATKNMPEPEDPVKSFQRTYFRGARTWTLLEDTNACEKEDPKGRRRAVWLYLTHMAESVKTLLLGPSEDADDSTRPKFAHCISINVNDDTDIKLGSGASGSTEVRAVMNNLQNRIFADEVVKNAAAGPRLRRFSLHQPLVALHRASAEQVFSEFLAWLLSFCGNTGQRLESWGIPSDIFRNIRRHVLVFIGDANKINDRIFLQLTNAVHYQDLTGSLSTAIQLRCVIHQTCLTRKTLALGFEGYWSTLVRFGHLFESHNFRQKFYVAMARLIQENFDYFPVHRLPEAAKGWNEQKMRALRMHSDAGGSSAPGSLSKRFRRLQKLLQKDNGDMTQSRFVHYCLGESCCPGGKDEALAATISAYTHRFDFMQVPLLYRWKHASTANEFIKDGFALHGVLPRTMELMPQVRCILAAISKWCVV